MDRQLTYSVIGTGAVGGYYGSRLALAGKDVHFLLHNDYEAVRDDGLFVESVDGDYHHNDIKAYFRTVDMPKSDVVLVCLKTVKNDILKTLLPPLLKEDTLVVLIQNGIGVEDDVQKAFPGLSIAAGLAFICAAKTEPGKIRHMDLGHINIGNFSCPDQALVESVVEDFREAGIKANAVDYIKARWMKHVWNMPFNGLAVALDTTTDRLLANPGTMQLVKDIMLEVISAGNALGAQIRDSYADKMIDMTLGMTPYAPSMKLDYDFGRPMEIEYLYRKPIAIAHKHGIRMPKCEALAAMLEFIEAKHNNA